VVSHDSDVDPIGACVGMRGSRVQNVVSELRGEKIDIINWTPDIARFACSALAPAEVTRVYVDSEEQSLEIIVPDDQLSLAIGKKGQNVRLAAKMTGWKIDIMSESRADEIELEEQAAASRDEAAATAKAAAKSAELPAKEAIALIKETTDLAALDQLLEGEERVTVRRAGDTRKVELGTAAEG
jgi:N utilization substance protein A